VGCGCWPIDAVVQQYDHVLGCCGLLALPCQLLAAWHDYLHLRDLGRVCLLQTLPSQQLCRTCCSCCFQNLGHHDSAMIAMTMETAGLL
jgi:hypothetical protein